MVLYVWKWDIHPDKLEAYQKWTESAIRRLLSIPGVVEFRAYRAQVGDAQVMVTCEFSDLAAWAAWASSDVVQQVNLESHTLTPLKKGRPNSRFSGNWVQLQGYFLR